MPLFNVPVTWHPKCAVFDVVIWCSCYLALYMCCVCCRYLMFLLPGTLNLLCLMPLFDVPVTWLSKCAVFDAVIWCSCYLALYMCCVWCHYLIFLLPGTLNLLCLMPLFDPITWHSTRAVFDAVIWCSRYLAMDTCCVWCRYLSQLMRLCHFLSSVNSFFKRACAATQ